MQVKFSILFWDWSTTIILRWGIIIVTVQKVVRLENGQVKLGIEAPRDVAVHRREVYDEIRTRNRESVMTQRIPVPGLAVLEDLTR